MMSTSYDISITTRKIKIWTKNIFCSQNPTDIISMNEALLVRFRSDDTIVNKGFSAAYVADDPMGSEELADRVAQEEEKIQDG